MKLTLIDAKNLLESKIYKDSLNVLMNDKDDSDVYRILRAHTLVIDSLIGLLSDLDEHLRR